MSRPVHFYPLVALSLLISVLAIAPAAAQTDNRSTVTVSGEGTVTAQPDQAIIRFGIVTQAESAQEARANNATAAKTAMNSVRALDIPEEKLRMETLRLRPRYEYDGERKLVGYEATRQVVVELNRLEVLPQLVANVVESGANQLNEISYQLKDRSQFRNAALRKAARSARDKARLLAETLDARLGTVHSINEQSFDFGQPRRGGARAEMVNAAGGASAEPEAYAAGEIEVSAQVQVVFDLVTTPDR